MVGSKPRSRVAGKDFLAKQRISSALTAPQVCRHGKQMAQAPQCFWCCLGGEGLVSDFTRDEKATAGREYRPFSNTSTRTCESRIRSDTPQTPSARAAQHEGPPRDLPPRRHQQEDDGLRYPSILQHPPVFHLLHCTRSPRTSLPSPAISRLVRIQQHKQRLLLLQQIAQTVACAIAYSSASSVIQSTSAKLGPVPHPKRCELHFCGRRRIATDVRE